MKNLIKDERYSVNKEWCGHSKQKFVARFCGDWIGKAETKNKAWLLCIYHDDDRNLKLLQ